MSRHIELSDTALTAPSRLDVAAVECMMLFPDDELTRQRAFNTCLVEFSRSCSATLPREVLESLFDIAADAPRLEDIQHEVKKKRVIWGTIAGRILVEAVGHSKLGAPFTMKAAVEVATRAFRHNSHPGRSSQIIRVEPRTVANEIWPKFGPVAHYWAAWGELALDGKKDFPCHTDDLYEFLAFSEAYRRLGESIRLAPRSPKPILTPDLTVRLPATIESAVPKLDLRFRSNAHKQ